MAGARGAEGTGRGGRHGLLTAQEHVQATQVTGRGRSHVLLTAQEHVQAAQVTGRLSWPTYSSGTCAGCSGNWQRR